MAEHLSSFAASRPGLSLSAAANLLVDEGLRMAAHPGIVFRDGPTGRRAGLAGGPDVWEVIRALESARSAEPGLSEGELLALVIDNTGLPLRSVRTALAYWASFPDEVGAQIGSADQAEGEALAAWRRQRDLLAR